MKLPPILEEAVRQLSKMPGVGAKTAMRQVLFLARRPRGELARFGESVSRLADLETCPRCGVYASGGPCGICRGPRSESGLMCVVETLADCMAIENSGTFGGTYHLLGGVLDPLAGIGPDELSMGKLFARIREEGVRGLVLAVNPSVEGDATCAYIRQRVGEGVGVERIGFGIPVGGHLEYLDTMTISKALENRRPM